MILGEVLQAVDLVPSDFAVQIVNQLKPFLVGVSCQCIGLWVGLKLVLWIVDLIMKYMDAAQDQSDWERVYRSYKDHSSDREMTRLKQDFWGRRNGGAIRSKRARKNKFWI